jgi:hypothetical protein
MPAGLRKAGRATWQKMIKDVPAALELDQRDLLVLSEASRLADTIADLEDALKREGVVLNGKLNSVVAELRQSRVAYTRLLAQIDLDVTGASQTATSRAARSAARRRWANAGPSRASGGFQ